MPDRFSLLAAVHLLVVDNDYVLLSRRQNTGYEDGKWSVPAGHLDGHESVRDAAVREAAEEIGLSLAIEDIAFGHVMHRRKQAEERVDFFMLCRKWAGTVRNAEPHKCAELTWAAPDDLPTDLIPYVRSGIDHCLAGRPYSEFGW